jgi:hypothetical protein
MSTRSDIDAIVPGIVESGGVIIRGFRSRDELASEMQAAVNQGKKCAFVPTRKTLREFFNTEGFILVMNDVNARLDNHDVVVEPNSYDSKHVFVVAPVNEGS